MWPRLQVFIPCNHVRITRSLEINSFKMRISWIALLLFNNSETNALPTTLRNCPSTSDRGYVIVHTRVPNTSIRGNRIDRYPIFASHHESPMCHFKFHVLSNQSKILNEQREVIESLHRIPVDIVNENPHQLVSDWDMLAFLNVITRYGWPCQIVIK